MSVEDEKAIVVKGRYDIKTFDDTPETIIIDVIKEDSTKIEDELIYLKTELDRLKKVEDKNIKLAIRLKEVRDKYKNIKDQYNKQCSIIAKLNRLDFTLYCPLLNKEISFYVCQDACRHKLCEETYRCLKRIEGIKLKFQVV